MSQTIYTQIASGDTPAAGTVNVYAKSGKLFTKDSAGNEFCCSVGASTGIVAITQGGTGASTAAAARTALGVAAASHSHAAAQIPGNVVEFVYRQGGDATDWSRQGTTDYDLDPSDVQMVGGVIRVVVATGDLIGNSTLTFPIAFTYKPIVFVPGATDGDVKRIYADLSTVTTTDINIWVELETANDLGNTNVDVPWVAFGEA